MAERFRSGRIFLAGDDVSWTAGWAEGAVTTALNAVWGVMHQFGGSTAAENPGPGDVFVERGSLRFADLGPSVRLTATGPSISAIGVQMRKHALLMRTHAIDVGFKGIYIIL